ncbi:hypothetical protein Hypma_013282 [Hypsizygus marmoreus]|uniref:Secreted protein n=1 Tax=Hypsizygus marmoreus TaxID=39966 RepID=A0A369JLB6_HYPMA|nr:hypothetical protein Hypma_013282 [Hypsizygus marmoreus]
MCLGGHQSSTGNLLWYLLLTYHLTSASCCGTATRSGYCRPHHGCRDSAVVSTQALARPEPVVHIDDTLFRSNSSWVMHIEYTLYAT